jgi:hypothetical protein
MRSSSSVVRGRVPSARCEPSQPAWLAAREAAQALVDEESIDAEAIRAAYDALTDAFDALVAKIDPYDSFRPGQEWLDTGGEVIQAHGGQVVPSTDADGRTVYYLYGEDRTYGYHSAPGVHVYSSYDLYNWEDRGVALRAMTSEEQFDSDPYFQQLYEGYTAAQREAVYRDLGTVPVAGITPPIIERPKVIYNESTGKWVMWAHMDGPSETSSAQYAKAKAGVAIADSPFGPFRYIDSYYLHHSPDGWGTPGMARDMNLFVDDDGIGYIIYSSEDNATMYISKLDEDYTYLATPPDQAVPGVDYNRIFVGESRESPAIFTHDERYFLITSGTTGWSPNPSRWATATDLMGEWTQMGDPFPWWAQSNSWNSQPSSVIPLDRENGKYIYMGDRWNGGGDLKNAQMVWLPLNMGEGGDSLAVEVWDEWTLDELDQWAVWDVEGVPATLPVAGSLDLDTVTVVQNGVPTEQPVEWSIEGSTELPGVVAVEGTLPEFGGRTFTRSIPVVPDGVRYAVSAGDEVTADWSALIDAVEGDGAQNSRPDQPFGADPATGDSWGYISDGSRTYGTGDMFSTLRYAVSGRDLTYRFEDLSAGSYTVYAGYADPWAQWDDRGARVTVNGEVREADYDYSADDQTAAYAEVVVGSDGVLTVSFAPTRGPDVQVSWLLVVASVPADTIAPEVTASTAPAAPNGSAGWFTSPPQLVAGATDASGIASIEVRSGAGEWAGYTAPITAPAGTTIYEVRATDSRGNVSAPQSVQVRVDGQAPTTVFTPTLVPGATTVALAATDANSGVSSVRYRLDRGAWTTYRQPIRVTGTGTHTISFQATDAAGNAETVQTRTFSVSRSLSLAPSVKARCVGDRAHLYVTVRNNGGSRVDIGFVSAYGSAKFSAIGASKVASFVVNSRRVSIPAGTVTITGAPAGGRVAVTSTVGYAGVVCQ